MGRQLSRLESEFVLSSLEELRSPLEVSLLQGSLSAAIAPAFCGPRFYSCNPNSMSFFFDEAFIKKANLPRDVPCRFCFFYKARRVCFTAAITSVNGKSFCHADALFYADSDSSFLLFPRGKLLFANDALLGVLSLRVHRHFPLDTANKDERAARFLRFAKSASGEAAFNEIEAGNSLDRSGKSGILFYLDRGEALACFPLAAAAPLLQRSLPAFLRAGKGSCQQEPLSCAEIAAKIAELKGAPQEAHVSLKFDIRSIEAECKAFLSAYSDNLLFCDISLLGVEPENIRYIYEMSHGEKYTGDDLQ